MTHTRTLTFACAVVAMLGAPLLQDSAEAQGRRGGDRQATGGRDGGRGGGRVAPTPQTARRQAEPANRGNGGRVGPPPRSGNRGVVGPRRTGRIAARPRRGGVVIGAYYRPLYYSSFYSPYYNGFYDPYYYSRYSSYYGGYSAYGSGQIYRLDSSLRLQVFPRTTEVFVDGYYAGTVDEYDGIFQRLRLEPGEYEMALYLPGYRTVTQRVLMQPDRTLKIKHEMVPLGPSDSPESRPAATGEPSLRGLSGADPGPQNRDASFGAIAVRVQPADADVLIDGERWEGPSNDEALVLDIAPGTHRVEVRKDGYRGYATQIDVQAGETAPINVSLPRE